MTTTTEQPTAREYLRVSLKKDDSASVDEQHSENERDAAGHGWTLGTPYTDDGFSASRYARKARQGYDDLVADLKADRFGGDVLILWETSRGSRRVGEWVLLIDLLEERGVKVWVKTHGRLYDPANPRDRRTLLEDAVDSEYETSKMSDRLRRSSASRAAQGRPVGQVPYGYRRVYDPHTRKLVSQDPEPVEATVIKELFERIAKGHSLRSIARDYEQRGIRSRSGKVFSAQHLRSLAVTHTYAGLRAHRPSGSDEVTVTEGTWEPIVDRELFWSVQRILTAPTRVTTRPGRARHFLSMIARCDVCDGPITARSGDDHWWYVCQRGSHVKVPYDELDDFAERVVLAYLSRPDVFEALSERFVSTEDVDGAHADVVSIRAELDDLGDQVGRGLLSPALAARAEPGIVARLRAAEAREKELSTPSVLRGLIEPGEDVARRWTVAVMSTRREVAQILFAPEYLGEFRVTRSPSRGQRGPIEDRVQFAR